MPIRVDTPVGSHALVEVGPERVPTSPTDEITFTCRLFELQFTNNTASDITVTVQDRQGTPITVIPAMTVYAHGGIVIWSCKRGRLMPNGVTWSASGAGLDGYMQAIQA